MNKSLKEEFEKEYYIEISTTKGIEYLAPKIGVSKNTLRRFLGKIKSKNQLSSASLNFIANFIGYNDYKTFTEQDEKTESTFDFTAIKIFYDSIKNKGVKINEDRFQDVNYQFAKKIIENPHTLNLFFTHFHNNIEALEYILGWHPSYGKIVKNDYQNILIQFSNKTQISHIKVFANSFVFFGKFISNNLVTADYDLIKKAEKEMIKMRKEYDFFWAFPEVRFAIAKTLWLYHTKDADLEKYINQTITFIAKKETSIQSKMIFDFYYADSLNLIGKFEDANILQSKHKDINSIINDNYYHSNVQIPFFKVSKAISCFKIGKFKEAKKEYQELKNIDFANLSFDIKDYIELQFSQLTDLMQPKNILCKTKIEHIKSKIGFTYTNNFL